MPISTTTKWTPEQDAHLLATWQKTRIPVTFAPTRLKGAFPPLPDPICHHLAVKAARTFPINEESTSGPSTRWPFHVYETRARLNHLVTQYSRKSRRQGSSVKPITHTLLDDPSTFLARNKSFDRVVDKGRRLFNTLSDAAMELTKSRYDGYGLAAFSDDDHDESNSESESGSDLSSLDSTQPLSLSDPSIFSDVDEGEKQAYFDLVRRNTITNQSLTEPPLNTDSSSPQPLIKPPGSKMMTPPRRVMGPKTSWSKVYDEAETSQWSSFPATQDLVDDGHGPVMIFDEF